MYIKKLDTFVSYYIKKKLITSVPDSTPLTPHINQANFPNKKPTSSPISN